MVDAAGWFMLPLLLTLVGSSQGSAQSLTVLPVNIQLVAGQKAATLTVINQGDRNTSVQIRAYAWSQSDGTDQLVPSDVILISPPLATIAPGARQTVRLVLRRSAVKREESYRIVLDQIPPPAQPGVIHVVLRMSLPVFAMPPGHPSANMQFHIERSATQSYLVALNDAALHEAFRELDLWTEEGEKLKTSLIGLQYILAGATRRWPIAPEDSALLQHNHVNLTAIRLTGPVKQHVEIVEVP